MSSKALKIAAGLLLAVLVLWLGSELLSERPDDRQAGRLFESLAGSDVDLVTLARAEDTVAIARFGNFWRANGLDASVSKVTALLNAMADPGSSEVVATSPAVHSRMSLADSPTVRVTFSHGGETRAELLFGRRGPDGTSYFARAAGSDTVYRYAGPLASLVDQPLEDWRNKIIVNAPPGSLSRLLADRGESQLDLTRENGAWRVNGAPADSAAVARLLGRLAPLEASGFVGEEEANGIDWSSPARSLTLYGPEGDQLARLLMDSTANGYRVRHFQGGTVYLLYRWTVDELMPADSTLRARGPTESEQ